MKTFWHI